MSVDPAAGPAGAPAGAPVSARRRGRRPAGEDTRAAILEAARSEFGTRGYEGATLRGIARAAGVDARLVHHYFDGKDDVFTAAMELPVRPQDIVASVLATGGMDDVGERLLRVFFTAWDAEPGRMRIIALMSSVFTSESAGRMVREFLTREVFARIASAIGADQPQLRASLVASQMAGLIMARYVIKIEPLASADAEDLIRFVAPTIQRYLTG